MKHTILSLLLCFMTLASWAQKSLMIQHLNGNRDFALVTRIDEITFSEDLSQLTLVSGERSVTIDRSDVAAMDYVDVPDTLVVRYQGDSVLIDNPYFLRGVSATVDGAHVTINNDNTDEELTFSLTGESTSGSFLYNASFKSTVILNGLTLNNPSGPAIDLQCGKRVALELKKGTVNTLTDGEGGDWKAALYCKGHLEIDKAGTLNVTGNTRHAISAKEYIQLKKAQGQINILGAKSDGIHCQQYFLANGYEVNIKGVAADGIQAERSGDEAYEEELPDGSLWIQGGTFQITCTGNDAAGLKADGDLTLNEEKGTATVGITMSGQGSKGMKADGTVSILAGDVTVSNSGAVLTEGSDTQTAKCISADVAVNLVGGNIQLSTTAAGGKCVKSDGTFTMGDKQTGMGPKLTASTTGGSSASKAPAAQTEQSSESDVPGPAYAPGGWGGGGGWPGGGGGGGTGPGGGGQTGGGSSAKAIKAMGAITLYGGETTITTLTEGAEGLESKKSISIEGGRHYLKTYDDAINCSGTIAFNGGLTVCCSTGNDAVDSNYGRSGAIVIGNGTVFTYTTRGGAEMGFDCDGNSYIQITGKGIAISAGGNQGGSSSSTLSNAAQGYAFITSQVSYQPGRYYTLSDSNGKSLITYSFEGNVSSSCSLITATGMTKGTSYSIKYGTTAPTDATDSFHGLYIGGTAHPTTNVTTFTAK